MRFAAWTLRSPARLAFGQRLAGTAGRVLGRRGRVGRLPGPLARWTDTRDAPVPPPESFRDWWSRR
jgi:L-lactate dehydrogenase complex protein LldF